MSGKRRQLAQAQFAATRLGRLASWVEVGKGAAQRKGKRQGREMGRQEEEGKVRPGEKEECAENGPRLGEGFQCCFCLKYFLSSSDFFHT